MKRHALLEDLKQFLEPDELHMTKLLIENVQLRIKIGKTIGEPFKTTLGICQGDCLSAMLFILYLSKTLDFRPHLRDHSYALPGDLGEEKPKHLQEHNYTITEEEMHEKYKTSITIPMQYADDCGYLIISEDSHLMKYTAAMIPPKLKRRNLICNESKNEDYEVNRKGSDEYKKCKYLGSLQDTQSDFKRRKQLSLTAMQNFIHIWKDTHLPLRIKIRLFNACVCPVMLAGSELWTMTKSLDGQVNAFQRKLLRTVLNIKYPKIIKTEKLKEIIKYEEWSKIIARNRLRWYGHALRLPEDTPCKQALTEYHRIVRHPRGKPKLTWMTLVHNQLRKLNINPDDTRKLEDLARQRNRWREEVMNR